MALLCISEYRDRLNVAVAELANASTISRQYFKFLKLTRESCEAFCDIHLVKLLNEMEGYTS